MGANELCKKIVQQLLNEGYDLDYILNYDPLINNFSLIKITNYYNMLSDTQNYTITVRLTPELYDFVKDNPQKIVKNAIKSLMEGIL